MTFELITFDSITEDLRKLIDFSAKPVTCGDCGTGCGGGGGGACGECNKSGCGGN